jgi:hypothetical protein
MEPYLAQSKHRSTCSQNSNNKVQEVQNKIILISQGYQTEGAAQTNTKLILWQLKKIMCCIQLRQTQRHPTKLLLISLQLRRKDLCLKTLWQISLPVVDPQAISTHKKDHSRIFNNIRGSQIKANSLQELKMLLWRKIWKKVLKTQGGTVSL